MSIFPEKNVILKPNEQKLIKVKAPFVDKISGMAKVKILDGGTHSTLLKKLKFTQNKAILDIVNKGANTNDIHTRRDDRNHKSKVVRVLQDQTRNAAAELKQVL